MDTCPVYINNRNWLTSLRNIVEYLGGVPGAVPIIVDNASTYPPLLKWYETKPCEIVFLHANVGPYAPWSLPELARDCPYYVVTDADLDLSPVPRDLLVVLRNGLKKYPSNIKAGLSLETNDLPPESPVTKAILVSDESWSNRLDSEWWQANVDTTFALYPAETKIGVCNRPLRGLGSVVACGPAIRADRPYTARHLPWYRTGGDEEQYFEVHCDYRWSTWSRWALKIERRFRNNNDYVCTKGAFIR